MSCVSCEMTEDSVFWDVLPDYTVPVYRVYSLMSEESSVVACLADEHRQSRDMGSKWNHHDITRYFLF
jgi:hypothetical protein